MESSLPVTASPLGPAQEWGTRLTFLAAGAGMAAWAPLVPFAKTRAGIDDGTLGMLLLCLGAGSIIAMPLAGALSSKFGCRAVILVSSVVFAMALPFLATLSTLSGLMAALLVFGMGIGSLDVSMNIQAVIVEKARAKNMMSSFHGMFSLGGMLGAAGVTALLDQGYTPLFAVISVLILVGLALLFVTPSLLSYGASGDGPLFAIPRGIVLLIGAVCFVIFLMEGAVLDWGAEFLTSHHGMPEERGGLGYTSFAVAMTAGRFAGDRIVHRLGGFKVVMLGGLIAAIGVGLTLIPSVPAALLGYALVGIGCSNIVPVMFSAAGRQTAMPANVAIPAITTLGYAGILVGPALIGFISHLSSLSTAFAIMTVLLVAVAFSARFVRL